MPISQSRSEAGTARGEPRDADGDGHAEHGEQRDARDAERALARGLEAARAAARPAGQRRAREIPARREQRHEQERAEEEREARHRDQVEHRQLKPPSRTPADGRMIGADGYAGAMRLYPAAARPLRATIAADVVVLLLLAVLAVLGTQVHDAVDQLAQIGEGVEEAGGSIRSAFDTAADGVDGLPLVGGDLAGILRNAGESTAGRAIDAGREGQEGVHDLAALLGWVTFAVPALLVAARPTSPAASPRSATSPPPPARSRPRSPATSAWWPSAPPSPLPYADLLRHSGDPFGDLARGHYAPLVAAALEHGGMRAPRAR